MDKSLLDRINFREQAIVFRLLNFLGQNGYVIEKFEKIVFEVEVDENDILVSNGMQLFKKGKANFVQKTDYLNLISLKSKRLLKSYTPEFTRMRVIIFSREEYLFEYSSKKLVLG
ncbi:MAG: hypothetical protein AB8F74_17905 [Saprospiraceae bacterium]